MIRLKESLLSDDFDAKGPSHQRHRNVPLLFIFLLEFVGDLDDGGEKDFEHHEGQPQEQHER
jgi:hypothetical protein